MDRVDVIERPEIRVIGVPHQGSYSGIGPAFERLAAIADASNLWPETREFLGVYLDDPQTVPEQELRSLAGLAVRDDLPLPDGLEQVRIPAGRYALLHHVGPYSGLGDAWVYLMREWFPMSELGRRDAPAVEIYRNTPGEVPEAELLTDLGIAVL